MQSYFVKGGLPRGEFVLLVAWVGWCPLLICLASYRREWYVRYRTPLVCVLRVCRMLAGELAWHPGALHLAKHLLAAALCWGAPAAWPPAQLRLLSFHHCRCHCCCLPAVMNGYMPHREAQFVGSLDRVPTGPMQIFVHLTWKVSGRTALGRARAHGVAASRAGSSASRARLPSCPPASCHR
jgi:hypothetical protein